MAQRLSIQNTREWCTTETGAPDPPEAASHSPVRRHASSTLRSASASVRGEEQGEKDGEQWHNLYKHSREQALIITPSVSARDSSVRIGRRVPQLCFLNEDLCSPTSGTTPFSTCHGDMTHP
ncbi:hypothetical protein JOQ06_012893 [Pogonophryne albipinna]|uniref:Uncharacterized protein n=1 Tax=Pogonophryne albipinna TaxID=1090488 RepID=A0AAD6BIW4_9TELE|nr:hypothetical protein JOQ06_012893 [Pogonophryne albipinna]